MNNDETRQYLKSYESGINKLELELEASAQLDEEMPMFMGLFNTQNNVENEGEQKFLSSLISQDDEESKLKDELLPEDTIIDNDEPLPQSKKRSLSTNKNKRKFKFSKVSHENSSYQSSAINNSEPSVPSATTSSKAEIDGKLNDSFLKTETNIHKSYRNLMINDFKLNSIIDDDSD